MNFLQINDLPVYDLQKEFEDLYNKGIIKWNHARDQICINTTKDKLNDYWFGRGSLWYDWDNKYYDENNQLVVPEREVPLKEEDFNLLSRLNDRLKMLDEAVSEVRNKGGFSVNSKLKTLSESQAEERQSITKQKGDIQNRLEKYRIKIEDEIFPSLEKLEEELLVLNLDKSKIDSEVKKLEAEIGPVKYIAEIVSDFGGPSVDASKAVRIVILILIFVFDPLAILLVVSASITFKQVEGGVPKDLLQYRAQLIDELEMHLGDGKPAETFIEKYKI